MKNSRNIFKEYNDPKIFREMKIGFACLIVLGILIAFLASPDLRHKIGIGDAEPLTHSHRPAVGNAKVALPGRPTSQGGSPRAESTQRKASQANSQPAQGRDHSKEESGSKAPSSGSNPSIPTNPSPGSPPTQQSSPPAPSNPGSTTTPISSSAAPISSGSSGESTTGESSQGGGKVAVEVPDLEVPSVVEETTEGVNGAVNGATGTVGEVTQETPVHVEPPEVCVLKC